jgi:hypothetical protein
VSRRRIILASLTASLEDDDSPDLDELEEVRASTLLKVGAVGAAAYLAQKAWKLPKPSKYSKRVSALEYAKALVRAKDNKTSMIAAVGLLNIAARVLLQIPELRDLGYRVMQVVQSDRLEDFLEER